MQRASRLPASIRWYLILAVFGLATGSLSDLFLSIPGYPVSPTSVAVSVVLNALLMIGVVRFHSNAARWIFAVWLALGGLIFLVGIIFYPDLVSKFSLGEILASVFTMSANVAAVVCLFTREAKRWFARDEAGTLQQVFD